MHGIQRVDSSCEQRSGRLSDAKKDILDKAAKCIPEHYLPVDGTFAYAAAGPKIQFIVLDLDGNVSLVPVFISIVTLPKVVSKHCRDLQAESSNARR